MKNLKEIVFAVLSIVMVVLIIKGERIDRTISTVKITGVVENPIGDTVKFYGPDSTYITSLDTITGIFSIEFDWDSAAFFSFFHGVESTKMFVKPYDEIQLTINTEEFDETIQYTGSRESSFLAWEYIYNEENEFPDIFKLPFDALDSVFEAKYRPVLSRAETFKKLSPKFYEAYITQYNATIESYKNRHNALSALPKVGEDPFDFTFSDRDGNDVSLSDFIGSVVYVDVWATWCGPCVYEVPFLVEIEEEYKGNNIVFLGVSVDTDAEAWMNFIDNNAMHSIHVNTGGWETQMMDDYAINGIPRFMIFDSNGKVFNLNAPRPSSDEIRPILDSLLFE
tara:strand:- start:1377 stop:2390 length:1014 start_codon:yes stop_codon:yes gene_type:complete